MDNRETGILLFGMICTIVAAGCTYLFTSEITTDKPITPTITIITENGVSDTTYTYKR